MTLRFRLTLWYTALLAVVLAIFAVVFHTVLARVFFGQVDDIVVGQAKQIVTIYERDINPAQGPLPTTIVLASQAFAQASAADGSVLQTTANLGDEKLPVPEEVRAQNLAGKPAFYTWREGDTYLRIFSAPVRAPDGKIVASIQVAQSLAAIEDMLKVVRRALLVGGSIALLLAALGGALIAGAALRPLNRIAETARRIVRAEDLDQRIEGAYPSDEIGQLAGTFNEMMVRLESLFNTQQQLVADVSHELRTPLATIQGNVDLLRRGAAGDAGMARESLEAMDAELARMSRLVRDLLLLAEADAGMPLQLRPVELDTLLLEVYREAMLMANGRVRVRLGHEDQAQVDGDEDRLKQLFLNLMGNAIAYTPDGGTVTLSLRCRPDGWVRVTISDTGVGIPPEELPHIFNRFWRANRARTREEGGSGLGLSIAKSIAEAHGGTVSVESELSRGSTFEVLLPHSRTHGANGAHGV